LKPNLTSEKCKDIIEAVHPTQHEQTVRKDFVKTRTLLSNVLQKLSQDTKSSYRLARQTSGSVGCGKGNGSPNCDWMNVEKLCKSSRSEELMLPTYIIERVRTSIAYLNSLLI